MRLLCTISVYENRYRPPIVFDTKTILTIMIFFAISNEIMSNFPHGFMLSWLLSISLKWLLKSKKRNELGGFQGWLWLGQMCRDQICKDFSVQYTGAVCPLSNISKEYRYMAPAPLLDFVRIWFFVRGKPLYFASSTSIIKEKNIEAYSGLLLQNLCSWIK